MADSWAQFMKETASLTFFSFTPLNLSRSDQIVLNWRGAYKTDIDPPFSLLLPCLYLSLSLGSWPALE